MPNTSLYANNKSVRKRLNSRLSSFSLLKRWSYVRCFISGIFRQHFQLCPKKQKTRPAADRVRESIASQSIAAAATWYCRSINQHATTSSIDQRTCMKFHPATRLHASAEATQTDARRHPQCPILNSLSEDYQNFQ